MSKIPVPSFNPRPRANTKKVCNLKPKKIALKHQETPDCVPSIIEPTEHYLSSIYDHTPICGITYLELCFYNIQQIGEGSLGLVYKARSYEDHKLYAIKKLKTPLLNNNDRSLKLEEIRKHAAIPKHPNCMQFYRAWTENNFLYTQLELCDDDFPLKYYSFFRLTNIKLEKVIRI